MSRHDEPMHEGDVGLMKELDERTPEFVVTNAPGINKRVLAFVGAMVALVLMLLAALLRGSPEPTKKESVQRVSSPSRPSMPSGGAPRAGGEAASRAGAGGSNAEGADQWGSGEGQAYYDGLEGELTGAGAGAGAGAAGAGANRGPRLRASGVSVADGQLSPYQQEAEALRHALQAGASAIPVISNPARGRSDRYGNAIGGAGMPGYAASATALQGERTSAVSRAERERERKQALLGKRLELPEDEAQRQSREQQEMVMAQNRIAERLLAAGVPGSGSTVGAGGDSRSPGQRAGDGPSSAQFLSEPDMLLARGTYIRCVLETRIITDLEGFASCVTAEPIYSTNGRRLLIPQGSKVLGSYSSGSTTGNRLAVVWDRVMTPNGIDITMQSPGVDTLGGAGHPGQYDAHWASRTGSAFFISLFSDAFKYYGEKYGPKTVTDTGFGGVTVQPFESNTARTMERVAHEAVEAGLNRPPTVTLNQGTVVSIYVAKDVDFSGVLPRAQARQ